MRTCGDIGVGAGGGGRSRRFLAAAALPLAAWLGTAGSSAAAIEPGVWTVSGVDARLGTYSGTLEIREGAEGGLELIRVVSLDEFVHRDGRAVDLVWTGRVEERGDHRATAFIKLLRADFIARVNDVVTTEADAEPLGVVGRAWFRQDGGLAIEYTAAEDPDFRASEEGVLAGPPGDEPIWRSGRYLRRTHGEPGHLTKQAMFAYFDEYHDRPDVGAYTDDPAFKRAVHYQVIDHTDFRYYRANPDRLRVIDKVVDVISLAETEIRANAFRTPLAEKAAFYQEGLTDEFLGPHGMVVGAITRTGQEVPDLSGALWTGIYAYTQARRHEATGDEEPLNDLRRAVRGLFTLIDITGTPRGFARTVRAAGPPLTGEWRRGRGPFAHLDYLPGGNNDMAKGLVLGLLAGWETLPELDPLRAEIRARAPELLRLCPFLKSTPTNCGEPVLPQGGGPQKALSFSDVIDVIDDIDLFERSNPFSAPDIPSVNPALARLFVGTATDNQRLIDDGLAWLHRPALREYAARGGGPIYVYGASDWSGNHLSLVGALILQRLLRRTDDVERRIAWRLASARAWRTLRRLDHPLHAALALEARALPRPHEAAEATRQVIWGLRSFPIPKHPHPIDHRVRGDFVLSPFPTLPWKGGWRSDPGRQQSLVAYPMLEQPVDAYLWNDTHFDVAAPRGLGGWRVPGVDYLFLYWLARDAGVITAGD
ncbi:MAG TPA: hypothetical protein VFG47_07565 [Geminicoccaceae bacterium]|nr:hypothetical protein [Geminicoccaceae bacterium]